jgi:hypothetical protein
MNLWLLLLGWAAYLAHATPLADSSALSVDDGAASTEAVASLGDFWAVSNLRRGITILHAC